MNIESERQDWKNQDSDNVNKYVDKIVKGLKEANAHPAGYMCIDSCFRAYLQWMHSAQIKDTDPELARNVTIKLMSFMTLEIAGRMSTRDEDGEKIATSEWLEEFVSDLGNEIGADAVGIVNKVSN